MTTCSAFISLRTPNPLESIRYLHGLPWRSIL